jgi:hypothetical protein
VDKGKHMGSSTPEIETDPFRSLITLIQPTVPRYFCDKKIPGIAFSVRNRKDSGKTKYFGKIKAGCFFLRL